MDVPKLLELTFLPAPDDNPLHSPEYQKGLRSFADSLEAEGGVSVEIELMDGPSEETRPRTAACSLWTVCRSRLIVASSHG